MTLTLGRHPTLREVIDYYTQEPFLRMVIDVTRRRRVVMVTSTSKHWEPNWARDEVRCRKAEALRPWIVQHIEAAWPDVVLGERPTYYPSFHQSVAKAREHGKVNPDTGINLNRHIHRDCVVEADLPTWRDAFQDVSAIPALLDAYAVPYLQKFSGHRSLHVLLPGDIMPPGYRGRSASKLAKLLLTWSGSQAHFLPKITRMPYSLNEDTGLVCLPIEQGGLDTFRPWQANLHLVEVPTQAYDVWGHDRDRDALAALIADVRSRGEGTPQPRRYTLTPRGYAEVVAPHRGRMRKFAPDGAVGVAWRRLHSGEALGPDELLSGLSADDPDASWLTAEAFLFCGKHLSDVGFRALIRQDEEYVRVSAVDSLLRFSDAVVPYAVAAMQNLDTYSTGGVVTAYLLTQSEALREEVFAALLSDEATSRSVRLTVACLTGALVGDWHAAQALARPLREDDRTDSPPQDRVARMLQALDIMATIGGWDKHDEAAKANALAALGPDIVDLLLVAASSPDRRFRRGIIGALAELADPRAVELLIHTLNDDYTKVRRKAIAGLIRVGAPAVPSLVEAASSDVARIRRHAVYCLAKIGAPDAKATVIEALHDAEQIVRRQAIRGLHGIVTLEDLPVLSQFLRDATPGNALDAVAVLETLGEPAARMLTQLALEEGNSAAAFFIASHGDPRGSDILVKQLSAEEEERAAAVEFLRELRDPRCVPYVIAELRERTDWRASHLGHELGRIGGPEAIAGLIEALDRDSHLVRRGAARGLIEAADPATIKPLVDHLDDPDSKTRKLVFDALLGFGEQALPVVDVALARTSGQEGRPSGRRRGLLRRLRDQLSA